MKKIKNRHITIATVYNKKGHVLAKTTNSWTKTHPYQAQLAKEVGLDDKQYLHAEVRALLKARGKQVYKIKIERYGANGEPLNACPCPICAKAIKEHNIKVIEYTL
jgi:deoxycytidylate deaminase